MTSGEPPSKPGVLFLVAVPIGNADDLTLRAIRILREADLIASEDPEKTRRLLSHHDIDATLTSYGPTNIEEKVAILIDRLHQGAQIALVSDCGSPVIADPGALLVESAHAQGIRVISVPGPSALTAAVAAAGLPGANFVFLGQLPETRGRMRRCLSTHPIGTVSAVAFCTGTSLALALDTLAVVAPQCHVTLACDLTKPNERIIRGTVVHIRRALKNLPVIQDITLILTGKRKRMARTGRNKSATPAQSLSSRRISTR
ncbi:MAG: 16S rRNA (cytidine(1402)-2'-O)-methyltransferase [Nitrospira sp.]|nr:16S rRNA (cytidine(1402)-2'-O)-methyltransferase [Nitrospira sp.]